MKITIAYLSEESEKAAIVADVLRQNIPDAKVKKTEAKEQYSHIYVTTRKLTSGSAKH